MILFGIQQVSTGLLLPYGPGNQKHTKARFTVGAPPRLFATLKNAQTSRTMWLRWNPTFPAGDTRVVTVHVLPAVM